MHPDKLTDIIRHRRTIKPKCFSDQSIDNAVVRQILENANWAPNHGMTQPWHLSVFVGPARQRLADFLATTYKQITPPELFKPNKHEGMTRNAMLAPVVIVVGMKRQACEKITELDEVMAVACAVQNMHLTATAHGLGGFWSTNVAATSPAMADFVGLSPKDRALGLFYLGYPASDWPTSNRDAMDEKVQWFSE